MGYKHHILYKTTNLVNAKYYVGIHSTNNKNDGYLGSGRIFIKALKRYGRQNFQRTILKEFKSREEALIGEAHIVNEDFISKTDNYNVTLGGKNGIGKSNKGYKHSEEAKKIIGESSIGRMLGKTRSHTEEAKRKIIEALTGREVSESTKGKIGDKNRGLKRSAEVVEHHRAVMKKHYKQNGHHNLGKKFPRKKYRDTETGQVFKSLSAACRELKLTRSTVWLKFKNNEKFRLNII